jgi:hypothetical protein
MVNRSRIRPVLPSDIGWSMMGGIKIHYDCIKAFSETGFAEDLKKIEVPVPIQHGVTTKSSPWPTRRCLPPS